MLKRKELVKKLFEFMQSMQSYAKDCKYFCHFCFEYGIEIGSKSYHWLYRQIRNSRIPGIRFARDANERGNLKLVEVKNE